jgi:hypothetical protein
VARPSGCRAGVYAGSTGNTRLRVSSFNPGCFRIASKIENRTIRLGCVASLLE